MMAVIQQDRLTFRRGGLWLAEWSVSLSAGEQEGRIDLKPVGQSWDVKGGRPPPPYCELLDRVKDGRGIFRSSGDSLYLNFVPASSADPLPRKFDYAEGRELLVGLRRKAH
jgi:hypothetical protein